MPIMRYKLIGTNMVERPSKGEWVRWADVKDSIAFHDKMKMSMTEAQNRKQTFGETENEATGDNKRSRK